MISIVFEETGRAEVNKELQKSFVVHCILNCFEYLINKILKKIKTYYHNHDTAKVTPPNTLLQNTASGSCILLCFVRIRNQLIIICLISKKMGNAEFQVPLHIRQQWVQTQRSGRKHFMNRITGQLFEFKVLSKQDETKNITQLIERSIYPIPKTPKIIILNDQKGQICILVQQFQYSFECVISQILLKFELLQKMKETCLVAESLCHKYGGFVITESMLGFNKNRQVLAWINDIKQKNQVEQYLKNCEIPEQDMITKIIKFFKKFSQLAIVDQFKPYQHSTFSSFIFLLQELIIQQKMNILKNNDQNRKEKGFANKTMNSNYNYNSLKNLHYLSPISKETQFKNKKRNAIPKFIKSIKQKKNGIIDSLHHCRTLTIEDAETNTYKMNLKKGEKNQFQTAPSCSIGKVRSVNCSPQHKNDEGSCFGNGTFSKISSHPSTNETNLTSSRESGNYILKKRQFATEKSFKQIRLITKTTTLRKQIQVTPNTEIRSYFSPSQQSFLFKTFQKTQPQKNLVDLCLNTTESQYLNEHQGRSIIHQTEEESHLQSKMMEDDSSHAKEIQEEFKRFLASPGHSLRNTLQQRLESESIDEQFSRIINF